MIVVKKIVHRTINARIMLAHGRKSGFDLIYYQFVHQRRCVARTISGP